MNLPTVEFVCNESCL